MRVAGRQADACKLPTETKASSFVPPSIGFNPFTDPAGVFARAMRPSQSPSLSSAVQTGARGSLTGSLASPAQRSMRGAGIASLDVASSSAAHTKERISGSAHHSGFLPAINGPRFDDDTASPFTAGCSSQGPQSHVQQVQPPAAESSYRTFVPGSERSTDSDWSDFDAQEFESMKVRTSESPTLPCCC